MPHPLQLGLNRRPWKAARLMVRRQGRKAAVQLDRTVYVAGDAMEPDYFTIHKS